MKREPWATGSSRLRFLRSPSGWISRSSSGTVTETESEVKKIKKKKKKIVKMQFLQNAEVFFFFFSSSKFSFRLKSYISQQQINNPSWVEVAHSKSLFENTL
jgi:hypothetical protein